MTHRNMSLHYSIPEGVETADGSSRPLLTTQEGGRIAVDELLRDLWTFANGRNLTGILDSYQDSNNDSGVICAALACLVEAGLLTREHEPVNSPGPQPCLHQGEKKVSVVIVGYKSKEWLEECLPSLRAQTYRPLEVVVVDNGRLDNTENWLVENFESGKDLTLRLVSLNTPVSFAAATNRGAAASGGDYLLFLNPDVRLEPDAIAEAVKAVQKDRHEEDPSSSIHGHGKVIVALKLRFWWAPAFLNGLGNRVGAFSWGTDNALGHLDLGQYDHWDEVPSACFAAALIDRNTWNEVGPADERFPMYYEDSEWSYRARLLGFQVKLAPNAVVYHAYGGKIPNDVQGGLAPTKLRHVVYGRFRFALKLVGKRLWTFLRNYFLEDCINFSRMLLSGKMPNARAYMAGWRDVIEDFSEIMTSRKALQSQRTLSDSALFHLPEDMPMTFLWNGLPELTWDLIQYHYYPLILSGKTKPMPEFTNPSTRPSLLIISNDVIDAKMAGPGMRYLEMAKVLSDDLDVTLAVPGEISPDFVQSIQAPHLNVVRYEETRQEGLQPLVDHADIALISGYMVEKFPFLDTTTTKLVVDLYAPFVLENLHYYLNEPLENQQALNAHAVNITNHLARLGDYFICGNERQRDYWLGVLTANGRTNPQNFIKDPTLNSLIDIVSIGFPDRPPKSGPGLVGIHPSIPVGSKVVLWGGGVWNWLDPLTLIKAWPGVIRKHPEARLVFLGMRHPNPLVPQHEMAQKTIDLAQQIGEKDKTIIFIEWVSYEEREALLCEAAVGVTLHPIHVETRFSLRTRVLDCFWADLPVLITDGDITSEWIREYGLGEVVPEHNPEAVTQALLRILGRSREDWKSIFAPIKQIMTWQAVTEPLRRYCLSSAYAPDRQDRSKSHVKERSSSFRWALGRIMFLMRSGGLRAVLHRGWRFIQWKLGKIK